MPARLCGPRSGGSPATVLADWRAWPGGRGPTPGLPPRSSTGGQRLPTAPCCPPPGARQRRARQPFRMTPVLPHCGAGRSLPPWTSRRLAVRAPAPSAAWQRPGGTAAVRQGLKILAAATGVGLLTGFFGVGGGFVIVPALVLALGFEMSVAVGTSLLVIAINSAAALTARLGGHAHLDWPLLGVFTAAALAGALAGQLCRLPRRRVPAHRRLHRPAHRRGRLLAHPQPARAGVTASYPRAGVRTPAAGVYRRRTFGSMRSGGRRTGMGPAAGEASRWSRSPEIAIRLCRPVRSSRV